jgi:hypothetical protein
MACSHEISPTSLHRLRSSEQFRQIDVQNGQDVLRINTLTPGEASISWALSLPGESFRLGRTDHSLVAAVEARFARHAAALGELVSRLSPALPSDGQPATLPWNNTREWAWQYRFDDQAFELAPATLRGHSREKVDGGCVNQASLNVWLGQQHQLLEQCRETQTQFLLQCVSAKQRLWSSLPDRMV